VTELTRIGSHKCRVGSTSEGIVSELALVFHDESHVDLFLEAMRIGSVETLGSTLPSRDEVDSRAGQRWALSFLGKAGKF
jgi:hypothetical protein